MLEQGWDLDMDTLMVLMMEIMIFYLLDTHWDVLMVKYLDLMKASN